jgi:hypothetical protein
MVQDVAYESLKLPGFVVSLALKFLSSQIEKKVHFDILKLKPMEFARECSVPCVFIIGAEDKLVYPKRVQQIFDSYLGKQKSLITSMGDHSAEREPHILQQCYSLITKEFKKNLVAPRATMEPPPVFVDSVSDDQLRVLAQSFVDRIEVNIHNSERKQKNRAFSQGGGRKFNFDVFLDETRNEENFFNPNDFNEQELIDYRMHARKNKMGGPSKKNFGDEESFSIRQMDGFNELGDVTEADFNENLNDLSVFLRSNKL